MRALVTGAAGFVGSHLVRRLHAEGHAVTGVDAYRGVTTRADAAARLTGVPVAIDELDLVTAALGPLLAAVRPDVVFHLAARPGARDADAAALHRDNVDATVALLAAAERAGVPRLVFASSSSVYSDHGSAGACREDGPVAPLSAYGEAKREAELHCLAAAVPVTIVRLFTVYGPGQQPDMAFARFIAAALDGGAAPRYQERDVARDFTYVGDAVDGLLRAARHGRAPVYNVSGGAVVPLSAACRIIEELAGGALATELAPAPPQPSSTWADLALARRDLGYTPATPLREGLARQVSAQRGAAALSRATTG